MRISNKVYNERKKELDKTLKKVKGKINNDTYIKFKGEYEKIIRSSKKNFENKIQVIKERPGIERDILKYKSKVLERQLNSKPNAKNIDSDFTNFKIPNTAIGNYSKERYVREMLQRPHKREGVPFPVKLTKEEQKEYRKIYEKEYDKRFKEITEIKINQVNELKEYKNNYMNEFIDIYFLSINDFSQEEIDYLKELTSKISIQESYNLMDVLRDDNFKKLYDSKQSDNKEINMQNRLDDTISIVEKTINGKKLSNKLEQFNLKGY